MPATTEIRQALGRAVGTGDTRSIRALYTAGAVLEARLPGRAVSVVGRRAVLEELSSWAPAEIRVLSERRSRGGLVLRLEGRSDSVGTQRRRHLIRVERGRIVAHVVYPERAPAESPPELPDVIEGPAADVIARIRERVALDPGISGCLVERWRLDDGRLVFAKHLRATESWLMRASADVGREAELLRSGILGRVAKDIDHALIDAAPEPEGWLLLSEDRSVALARPPRTPATRRRLLGAVRAVHERFRGLEVPVACPMADRLRLFSPATAARELEGSDFAPKVIGRGWELFAGLVPADVASAVTSLAERPEPLVRALDALPVTLAHGDLRPGNVGWSEGHAVLVDWGLAIVASPAFEMAWWVFNAGWRSVGALDRLLAEARIALPSLGEPAIDLGILATLVQAGAYFGFEAVQNPDPAARRRARDGLAWWVSRASVAMDAVSP